MNNFYKLKWIKERLPPLLKGKNSIILAQFKPWTFYSHHKTDHININHWAIIMDSWPIYNNPANLHRQKKKCLSSRSGEGWGCLWGIHVLDVNKCSLTKWGIIISLFNFSFITSCYYRFDIPLSRIGTILLPFSYVISKNPHILWVTPETIKNQHLST